MRPATMFCTDSHLGHLLLGPSGVPASRAMAVLWGHDDPGKSTGISLWIQWPARENREGCSLELCPGRIETLLKWGFYSSNFWSFYVILRVNICEPDDESYESWDVAVPKFAEFRGTGWQRHRWRLRRSSLQKGNHGRTTLKFDSVTPNLTNGVLTQSHWISSQFLPILGFQPIFLHFPPFSSMFIGVLENHGKIIHMGHFRSQVQARTLADSAQWTKALQLLTALQRQQLCLGGTNEPTIFGSKFQPQYTQLFSWNHRPWSPWLGCHLWWLIHFLGKRRGHSTYTYLGIPAASCTIRCNSAIPRCKSQVSRCGPGDFGVERLWPCCICRPCHPSLWGHEAMEHWSQPSELCGCDQCLRQVWLDGG